MAARRTGKPPMKFTDALAKASHTGPRDARKRYRLPATSRSEASSGSRPGPLRPPDKRSGLSTSVTPKAQLSRSTPDTDVGGQDYRNWRDSIRRRGRKQWYKRNEKFLAGPSRGQKA